MNAPNKSSLTTNWTTNWTAVFHQNKSFWVAFAATWCVGFGLWATQPKGASVLWLAAQRTDFWNDFFCFVTQFGAATPYFIIGILLLLLRRWQPLAQLSATGLSILLIAYLLKNAFAADRPWAYFDHLHQGALMGKSVEIEGYFLSVNSFPSGHTMGGFGWATLTVLWLPKKYNFAALGILLLAILVGVSRLYLGEHFLEDVLMGSLLGATIAVVANKYLDWK